MRKRATESFSVCYGLPMSNHETGTRYTAKKRREVEAARKARVEAELRVEAAWTLEQHAEAVRSFLAVHDGMVQDGTGYIPVEEAARRRQAALLERFAS